jgi:hypothetical protein
MEITGWVMFVDVGSSMYYQGLSEGGGGGGGGGGGRGGNLPRGPLVQHTVVGATTLHQVVLV